MPRQYERVSVSLEVVLQLPGGEREARVSDISRGGCFIDTLLDPPDLEKILFRIKTPEGVWVQMAGTVAYKMAGFGFGLSFTLPFTEFQRNHIFRIIFTQGGKLSGYQDPGR